LTAKYSVTQRCRARELSDAGIAQVTSLALKLVSAPQDQWSEWVLSCTTSFSNRGATTAQILDFLAIVAEEIERADLLGSNK
jgi:hypothetical protein